MHISNTPPRKSPYDKAERRLTARTDGTYMSLWGKPKSRLQCRQRQRENIMYNIRLVIKPGETPTDIIEQICTQEKIRHDDFFAFSAIMTRDPKDPDLHNLKINCLVPPETNPFTPQSLVINLFTNTKEVKYLNPPLEQYFVAFRPLLFKMVDKAYPIYQKLIPDKDELMCILSLTIVDLYHKGYYLHKHLIYKTFINQLNKDIRKLKNFGEMLSLDEEISQEDDTSITRKELLMDPVASDIAYAQYHYTQEDFKADRFEQVKKMMLQDMSELSFDCILLRLKSKTIDTQTSRIISKYREILNPGCPARPNAFGKSKHKRKEV